MPLRYARDRAVTPAGDGHAHGTPAVVAFHVDVAREHGAVRVSPVGEIDLATSESLRARIHDEIAAGPGRLILDLRRTTFLDSAGLHLAVEGNTWAARNGTEFAIVAGPPAVQRIFDLAGLTASLPFVDVPRA